MKKFLDPCDFDDDKEIAPRKLGKPRLRGNVVYKLRDPATGLFLVQSYRGARFSEEGSLFYSRFSVMRIWLKYDFERARKKPWNYKAGAYHTPDLELVSLEMSLAEKTITAKNEDVTALAIIWDKYPPYYCVNRFIQQAMRSRNYKKMLYIVELSKYPDADIIPADFKKQIVYRPAIFGTYTEADAIYLKMLLAEYGPTIYDLEKIKNELKDI